MARRWFLLTFSLGVCALAPTGSWAAPEAQPAAAATAASTAGKTPETTELNVTVDDTGAGFSLIAINAPLKTVLATLAKESGWDVRMEPESAGKVTLTLTGETFERVVAAVAETAGCTSTRVFVLSPKKEGQELPDHFKLPMGLPTASLTLAQPTPVAGLVAAIGAATGVTIEAAPELKGEAALEANAVPLPDVLDTLCQKLNAVWTISYRVKPKKMPKSGSAASDAADPEAAAMTKDAEEWEKLTPEQRQQLARQQVGSLLRATPAERREQIQQVSRQIHQAARVLNRLSGEARQKLAKSILERSGPYLQQVGQLTPEQQRDFAPAVAALNRLLGIAQQPAGRPGKHH